MWMQPDGLPPSVIRMVGLEKGMNMKWIPVQLYLFASLDECMMPPPNASCA